MEDILGPEIGRGGYGVVYVHKKDPSLCVKRSDKSGKACREWSNEYKKIMTMVNKIKASSHKLLFSKMKMVKILAPTQFNETSELCYMILPRIFRPEGKDVIRPTIQAQLGVDSVQVVHKGRGEFMGLQQLKKIVSTEKLEAAAYELGLMMGIIHFHGHNDAYDIEVFLGKEKGARQVRFYIADFDLTEEVKAYDEATIERMYWSLDAVPYFPKKDVDPTLYDQFRKGYAKVAPSKEIEAAVFEHYDE
jgi:hypothetical protein